MRKLSKILFFWAIGGSIYYTVEIIFRGFSHWTMFVLGGICFLFIHVQGRLVHYNDSLMLQIFRSMVFITAMEFITGIIVNKWLHMNVWDYSDMPMQLFGQICIPFVLLFSGLSALGIVLSGYIGYWIYGEEKPYFHIL